MIDGSGSYSYLAYCCPPRQLGMWGGWMGRENKGWGENEEEFLQHNKGKRNTLLNIRFKVQILELTVQGVWGSVGGNKKVGLIWKRDK